MAFETLCGRYSKQLFRVAHRITRSREDAEDAVQDTLLRAFLHVGDFDGRCSFGTWLTRIAINSALMILRKNRASHEIAADYNDDSGADGLRYEMTDHQPNPEKRYAQSEEETMLKKAIQDLRPTLRVVVQIQELQEQSMRETAEAIGISLAATKGRLFNAKKALRRSMTRKLAHQLDLPVNSYFARRMMVRPKQTPGAQREKYVIETDRKPDLGLSGILQPRDGRGFS